MPPPKKPKAYDNSFLSEMLAIRLQQLETESGGLESFLPRTGLARGTYYGVIRGVGNPTLRTVGRLAASLNMSAVELLGFDLEDARRALERSGVDYDTLMAALGERVAVTRRVNAAKQSRERSSPPEPAPKRSGKAATRQENPPAERKSARKPKSGSTPPSGPGGASRRGQSSRRAGRDQISE